MFDYIILYAAAVVTADNIEAIEKVIEALYFELNYMQGHMPAETVIWASWDGRRSAANEFLYEKLNEKLKFSEMGLSLRRELNLQDTLLWSKDHKLLLVLGNNEEAGFFIKQMRKFSENPIVENEQFPDYFVYKQGCNIRKVEDGNKLIVSDLGYLLKGPVSTSDIPR